MGFVGTVIVQFLVNVWNPLSFKTRTGGDGGISDGTGGDDTSVKVGGGVGERGGVGEGGVSNDTTGEAGSDYGSRGALQDSSAVNGGETGAGDGHGYEKDNGALE